MIHRTQIERASLWLLHCLIHPVDACPDRKPSRALVGGVREHGCIMSAGHHVRVRNLNRKKWERVTEVMMVVAADWQTVQAALAYGSARYWSFAEEVKPAGLRWCRRRTLEQGLAPILATSLPRHMLEAPQALPLAPLER
jgi:hypothetical protein